MEPLYKKYSETVFGPDGKLRDFKLICPDNFNFAYDVIDVTAAAEPDKRALVWCNSEGEERSFTFSELSELSNRAANLFAAHGIKKGSRVLLMMKRHYSYWYALLGLHKLGAVAIPATHMLTAEDLDYRIKTAGVDSVICVGEDDLCRRVLSAFPEGAEKKRLFSAQFDHEGFIRLEDAVAEMPATFERVPNDRRDLMLIYFTSGTTGNPKAVLHSFSYPLYHIPTALFWQQVTDNGLHLSVADTGWAKASWGKIYGQWLCASAVMVYDCVNLFINDLLAVIKKYSVTTFCAPPTVYRSMVKNGFDPKSLTSVKHFVTAGEDLKASISESFTARTGKYIYSGYGQTETALVTANLYSPDCESLGLPMPLYNLLLVDEDQNPIEGDGQGEVVLVPKDPELSGICVGYINDEGRKISSLDENGRFHTGDIVSRTGERLLFAGRTDDMIKSAGFRISPKEIEEVLIRHPDVTDCAVAGVKDVQRGYIVKAFIVLKKGLEPSVQAENCILRYAHEHLASYKCPRAVEFREHLPKTISGKLRRNAL